MTRYFRENDPPRWLGPSLTVLTWAGWLVGMVIGLVRGYHLYTAMCGVALVALILRDIKRRAERERLKDNPLYYAALARERFNREED